MRNQILAFIIFIASSNVYSFDSFSKESGFLSGYMGCFNSKVIPGDDSWGALFQCLGGGEETVKLYVNEIPGTGRVKNIKFLWNEYSKNVGYIPAHADKPTADMWIEKIGKRYAPENAEQIASVFKANVSKSITANGYVFKYTFTRGPAANERMIVITQS